MKPLSVFLFSSQYFSVVFKLSKRNMYYLIVRKNSHYLKITSSGSCMSHWLSCLPLRETAGAGYVVPRCHVTQKIEVKTEASASWKVRPCSGFGFVVATASCSPFTRFTGSWYNRKALKQPWQERVSGTSGNGFSPPSLTVDIQTQTLRGSWVQNLSENQHSFKVPMLHHLPLQR